MMMMSLPAGLGPQMSLDDQVIALLLLLCSSWRLEQKQQKFRWNRHILVQTSLKCTGVLMMLTSLSIIVLTLQTAPHKHWRSLCLTMCGESSSGDEAPVFKSFFRPRFGLVAVPSVSFSAGRPLTRPMMDLAAETQRGHTRSRYQH